ncbi:hypothetical protein BJF88_13275 [Cellulosimicrobium sp. CUA-896]|nr:hypothetical protein BJF88_13275 [Cellulosimicrobium sp. CUA-896]
MRCDRAGGRGELRERVRERRQVERVGAGHVRDDEAAVGRDGDAEVDVRVVPDLGRPVGQVVPRAVELGVPRHREAQRAGGERGDRDPGARASRCVRSRARSSVLRVTSAVRNTLACGAVNALATIAAAVCLRTPRTGTTSVSVRPADELRELVVPGGPGATSSRSSRADPAGTSGGDGA